MSRQSRKGNAWQNACEGYLREFFDDTEGTIHVERLHGRNDEGDIHGLFAHGQPIAVECKNCGEYKFPEWVAEAEAEAANAGSAFGVAFIKRKGRGLEHVADHWALMSIGTFCGIIDAAPSDMLRAWGGSDLRGRVERYARRINAPVEEVLFTLLRVALDELEER